MIELPAKPRYAEACNGCGLCCAIEICPTGRLAYPKAVAPCPALMMAPNGKRTHCGLVVQERAEKLPPVIAERLGIGRGCGMNDYWQGQCETFGLLWAAGGAKIIKEKIRIRLRAILSGL